MKKLVVAMMFLAISLSFAGMAFAAALNVTDATYEAEVTKSNLPVVVDFWAPWCGYCRKMAPAVEALADEYAGKVKVVRINTDSNKVSTGKFKYEGIPAFFYLKDGKVAASAIGFMTKEQLKKELGLP